MENPTVVVTGASRGLGAHIARQLALLRVNVVLMARNQEHLMAVAQECETLGGKSLPVAGDVSREEDCSTVVQEAVRQFGQIHALINNSGVIEPISMLKDTPLSLWQHSWAVNVLGPVMLIQKALPYLREQHGRVINITSGSVENIIGGWGPYISTKGAINKITQVLAKEEPLITAGALKPGIIDTDMQAAIREKGKSNMLEQNYQWLSGLYEQKRMNSPERPALAAACLALSMPIEWSGEVLQWDEGRVQDLVNKKLRTGESS